jgi:hypothetical protein
MMLGAPMGNAVSGWHLQTVEKFINPEQVSNTSYRPRMWDVSSVIFLKLTQQLIHETI